MIHHTSVLRQESIDALNLQPGKTYVDATLGGGGHSEWLCRSLNATNTLIGIDQDPIALARARERLKNCQAKCHFLRGNFSQLPDLLASQDIAAIDGGILADLGVSDFQIKTPARGFSFMTEAPLDMRMNPDLPQTAADLLNTLDAQRLADLFYRYGEEKLSRPIAAAVCAARPVVSTCQLARIAQTIYRQKGVKAKNIHPATRIFQALRIAVNQELEVLEALLSCLPQLLLPGARAAIITFHSLEDRLVKDAFRLGATQCICPPRQPVCTCHHQAVYRLLNKPITPSPEELKNNPQSRSAKLRLVQRV